MGLFSRSSAYTSRNREGLGSTLDACNGPFWMLIFDTTILWMDSNQSGFTQYSKAVLNDSSIGHFQESEGPQRRNRESLPLMSLSLTLSQTSLVSFSFFWQKLDISTVNTLWIPRLKDPPPFEQGLFHWVCLFGPDKLPHSFVTEVTAANPEPPKKWGNKKVIYWILSPEKFLKGKIWGSKGNRLEG